MTTRERPIIFDGEMIHAILDGRKTQTRRVWKKPKRHQDYDVYPVHAAGRFELASGGFCIGESINCPYGESGDRLWVRETWCPMADSEACAMDDEPIPVVYKADWDAGGIDREEAREAGVDRWHPSIHMPRWASRITLEITKVRVETLQSINYRDAIAEGIKLIRSDPPFNYWSLYNGKSTRDPCFSFRMLWDSINAKRGHEWDTNPYVWVIEFCPEAPDWLS